MDAKELRIGNLLSYVNQKVIVLDIVTRKGYDVELGYFTDSVGFERKLSDKDVEPIPLTEEWLLKFGFDDRGCINLMIDETRTPTTKLILRTYSNRIKN